MMPELGNFLLCLAAGLALLLSVYPLWGAARQDRRLMALARPLACGLFACIGGAFLLLVHAFVVNDFTVRYVAENSNSALPVWYRVAATWGAHEGSLLLWVLLLSVWTFAVAIFSRRMPLDAVARVLAVMGMLGNNILLMAAMLVVLLGTLLPLVHKELGLGSISIGEPFFNTMFTALMAPFALLLGLGPLIRWRRDDVARQIKRLIIALLVTLSLSLALPWLLQDRITAMAVIGLMMALWVLIFALMEVHERATHRHGFWRGLRTLTRSQWGMVLGHVGVAVTVIGITFSQNYSVERDVRMRPGDSIDIHRYHFVFNGVRNIVGPNWTGGEGIIAVTRNGRPEATLYAEKRFYTASRMMMTEAAISGGLTRDLYAALGEELSDGSWAVRLYYKPFVRWIWYGGVLMALGGLCCMLDPRYRMRKKLQEAS
ncbi:TPA: cytochrome c-type biogenesis CcmF C-terminal domain-containing protein [Klebsiella pneumoniae]